MYTLHLVPAALLLFCLALLHPAALTAQAAPLGAPPSLPSTLQRHYQNGEIIAYRMQGDNQGHLQTTRYQALANGVVNENSSGTFVEEFAWSHVHVNGATVPLTSASRQFREYLSLAPGFGLSIPDLSQVQPILIGPITDLLTIYADVQLAMRQRTLQRPGDHTFIKYGRPNSWADGRRVLLGQDAIDFDITLQSIDPARQVATLIVRHVPPVQPQIQLPADWMNPPIGDTPNNWVQIEKVSNGKFVAGVGRETFEDTIEVSIPTGSIVSATLDNPVQILERDCTDRTLTNCSAPMRYRIHRQVMLDALHAREEDSSPQAATPVIRPAAAH
jgi:hypothetical protein